MVQPLVGLLLLAITAVLVVVAWPNRTGPYPRFLQFESAVIVYPPIIMVFLALGVATLVSWALGVR